VVTARRAAAIAGALAMSPVGCKPDLNQTVSLVTGPQILAVRSDPAEGAPKTTIHYAALIVDSAGPLSTSTGWAFCDEREPLAELGPVSPKCYAAAGDWFVPFGVGATAQGVLPAIACRQFGPEVPVPQANQPPGRPVDPDATGGYYQPVRVLVPASGGDVIGIAETRLSCGLAGTPDQAAQFARHYITNSNPAIDSLSSEGTSFSTDEQGAKNPVPVGASLLLRVGWASCPQPTGSCGDEYCDLAESAASCPGDCMTLTGCSGAETYPALDISTHSLVTRREGMQVSWFSTGGTLDNDRTGRDPSDGANFTTNTWHAPGAPGMVHLWAVLRDDRGGTGWAEYAFDVR
jgi:hypothetical protein